MQLNTFLYLGLLLSTSAIFPCGSDQQQVDVKKEQEQVLKKKELSHLIIRARYSPNEFSCPSEVGYGFIVVPEKCSLKIVRSRLISYAASRKYQLSDQAAVGWAINAYGQDFYFTPAEHICWYAKANAITNEDVTLSELIKEGKLKVSEKGEASLGFMLLL